MLVSIIILKCVNFLHVTLCHVSYLLPAE